jgi:gliding motility-associated protein GldM
MAQYTFRVRKLPEPSPFITVTDDQGNPELFRGGFLSKQKIIQADAVSAAVDDGLLNIPFRVQSFEMVFFDNMGNAVPVAVEGTSISKQQKDIIKKLSRGKRFYISRMVATGPDGIERKLNTSMEVIIR